MRGISKRFISDLLQGELAFFLKQVQNRRKDLSLEIRGGYINIYYRGGNLLKITEKRNRYAFQFDSRYCLTKGNDSNYQRILKLDPSSAEDYSSAFDLLIKEMESWFAVHPKPEREYQHQLLVHNESVIDIEYQIRNRMRLDMLMTDGDRLLIVENKYGLHSISGSAGLAKHYRDIAEVLCDPVLKEELYGSVQRIAECKQALGLLEKPFVTPDPAKEGILFLLADYNLKSRTVQNELDEIEPTVPAWLLLMAKDEYVIDLSNAEELFGPKQ